MAHQGIRLRSAPADYPSAAGHLHQHGRLAVARQVAATPDVGQVGPAVGAVGDDVGLLDETPARDGGAQRRGAAAPAGPRRRVAGEVPPPRAPQTRAAPLLTAPAPAARPRGAATPP